MFTSQTYTLRTVSWLLSCCGKKRIECLYTKRASHVFGVFYDNLKTGVLSSGYESVEVRLMLGLIWGLFPLA